MALLVDSVATAAASSRISPASMSEIVPTCSAVEVFVSLCAAPLRVDSVVCVIINVRY
jgi:hypothetical protein